MDQVIRHASTTKDHQSIPQKSSIITQTISCNFVSMITKIKGEPQHIYSLVKEPMKITFFWLQDEISSPKSCIFI